MLRLIAWLIGLSAGASAFAAFMLFTATGNSLLTPLIEQALQEHLPQARITELSIRPQQARLHITLNSDTQLLLNADTNYLSGTAQGQWQLHTPDLTPLEPLTKAPLSGPASGQGTFALHKHQMQAEGQLRLTQSRLDFNLTRDGEDQPIRLNSTGNLLLSEISQLLRQPRLASGEASTQAALTLDNPHDLLTLNGTTTLSLPQGIAHKDAIAALSGIALPADTPFSLNARADVLGGKVLARALLDSELANINVDEVRHTLGSDGVAGQHHTHIPDLTRLVFVTGQPLHGRLQVDGDFAYTLPTRHLKLTASSNTLGGRIDADLNGLQATARLHDLQTTEISRLLGQKPVFQSSVKGQAAYHLGTASGTFDATLFEGRILPNDLSALLNNAAKFDITREVYERVRLDGTLTGPLIIANLDMASRLTHITSQQAHINLSSRQIDATLNIDLLGKTLPITLRGDMKNPDIGADASALLGKQAEQAVQQAVDKEKKKLEESLQQQLQKALPGGLFGR